MSKFIFLLALTFAILLARNVVATNDVCFCHNVQHNPHTICTDNNGHINGHMGHVNNGEDTLGECQVNVHSSPTPTTGQNEPTVTPSDPTETPTLTPTLGDSGTPVPTVTEGLQSTSTPVPTEGLTRSFTSDFTKTESKNESPNAVNEVKGEPNKGIWK